MQLMPETARSYGVDDVFDPEQNIRAGVKIMKQLLVQFDGDVELAPGLRLHLAGGAQKANVS